MKIRTLHQLSILFIGILSVSISSCGEKDTVTGEYLLPISSYKLNGNSLEGQGKINTTLKAIEIPCANNNTIRMYISDSLDVHSTAFSFEQLTIVSYQKAGHLNRKECYIEVSSSATDTWLSTGTGNVAVKTTMQQYHAGPGADETAYVYYFDDVTVQHFTSVPLTDLSKVSAVFKIK